MREVSIFSFLVRFWFSLFWIEIVSTRLYFLFGLINFVSFRQLKLRKRKMRVALVRFLFLAFAFDCIIFSSATILLKSLSVSFTDLPAKFGNSPSVSLIVLFGCWEICLETERKCTSFYSLPTARFICNVKSYYLIPYLEPFFKFWFLRSSFTLSFIQCLSWWTNWTSIYVHSFFSM